MRGTWRRLGVDIGITAAVMLYSVGDALTFSGSGTLLGLNRPALAIVTLAGCLVLLVRRRRPITVAVLCALVNGLLWTPFLLIVGLASAAGLARAATRVVAVTVFAIVLQFAACVPPHGPPLDRALFWSALYVGAAFIGWMFRRYQRLTEQRAELAAAAARQDERARIAREMHDVVAHRVSLMVVDAGALEVARDRGGDWTAEMARRIRESGRRALEELRETLTMLGDQDEAPRAPLSGVDDIPTLVAGFESRGLDVQLSINQPRQALRGSVDKAIYRVVREGLTNVLKHAAGARASVVVAFNDDRVEVKVVNTRPRSDRSHFPGGGAGLIGLRERVALLGGVLEAGPTPDGGFRLDAVLPYEAREAPDEPDR
ncbi:hypothetical protein J4573_11825 [Actinomadura barringtoniae]|uniref:histidine kinase n=1 Tax=Actinomadura barringtoniae TaxID=1427535 RepID=A0A939PFX9_9ACTN|nr:histidine kinase [Actinomadura barringtoniae]MBO2447781.1 hypothetical protein [Actinomadura barringtoniae]